MEISEHPNGREHFQANASIHFIYHLFCDIKQRQDILAIAIRVEFKTFIQKFADQVERCFTFIIGLTQYHSICCNTTGETEF